MAKYETLIELVDALDQLDADNQNRLLGAAAMLKLVAAQQQTTTDDKSA